MAAAAGYVHLADISRRLQHYV